MHPSLCPPPSVPPPPGLRPAGALLCLALSVAGPVRADSSGSQEQGDDSESDDPSGATVLVEAERPDPADPDRTAASVVVVEVDERLPASADVATAVDTAAGASVQSLGGLGDFSAVSLRGSSLRQVQVYLDGVPLNPEGNATVNLSELPLRAFDRIEIYRSNPPPELAAAPIGGVVNLVTAPGGEAASASVAGGSYGTGRAQVLSRTAGDLSGTPSEALLVGEAFRTRGDFTFFDDNGTTYDWLDDSLQERENNDKRQLAVHGRWRLGDDRLRLTLLDAFLAREEGVAGHANDPARSARLGTLRNLAVAELEATPGAARIRGRLWHHQRLETLDDREGELGAGNEHEQGESLTAGALVHAAWAPASWLLPSATLALRSDTFHQTDLLSGERAEPRRRHSATVALAAHLWAAEERLVASPVVQLTALDNRALGEAEVTDSPLVSGTTDTITSVDPRIGLLWRPLSGVALEANAGHYLRPPDLTELFGDRGATAGNTDLRPESGWKWDVGTRLSLPPERAVTGALDVAHFWSSTQDLIAYVQNSQRTLVPVNVGRAWVQGLEAALTVQGWGWVDSRTNLAWTVSRNLESDTAVAGNQLPRVPAWELYQGSSVHWEDRVRLGHTFSFTAGNYWDATNWYRSAPRAIHGLFLRARLGRTPWSAELDVLNVGDRFVEVVPRDPALEGDENRVVQAITDFVGYPLPGRTWLLTLSWSPRASA